MESTLYPGQMLIAHSGLLDANFKRTVVLLTEHNEDGTMGYVLNRKLDATLADVITDQYASEELTAAQIPLYWGGPCQIDSLHYVHRLDESIEGARHIVGPTYWGGSFDEIFACIHNKTYTPGSLRFFVGYAGWSEGQLQQEIEKKSWLLTTCKEDMIFADTDKNIWSRAVRDLGPEFTAMSLMPEHPSLN